MPLFRSNTHGNEGSASKSRRSDLHRQIGCIAGFFHLFNSQARVKQIAAGPPKETRDPLQDVSTSPGVHGVCNSATEVSRPAELPCSSPVSATAAADESTLDGSSPNGEADSSLRLDGKAEDEQEILDSNNGDAELGRESSLESTRDNHPDNAFSNFGPEEFYTADKPAYVSNAATNVTESSSGTIGTMVRHNSFKDRDHDAITFSPRKGSVAAYVAGGRRFISEGSDYTAWNSCVDPLEDGISNRTEEDKSAFFSSPASQWPSIDDTHGQAHELKGWKGAQLTYHGQVAEPHPATRESLEEWKESLRALSKLKKEVAAGGFSHRNGTLTPNVSYSAIRNELLPMSPARASAFDFKEVIRWSERSSFPESFARRSWDDRDLPRSIADLRNAINVRSRASTMASPPPSPRPPGVVARLMGLDNFPQEQSTLLKCIERKPSSEAKLLQQLLQCSPSPSCSPSPPNAAVKMKHQDNDVKCDMRSPFQSSPNSPDSDALRRPDSLRRPEFQSMLKRAELLGNDLNTSDIKTSMTFSKHPKPHKISAMAEPHPLQSVPLKRSRHRNHLPVVILKQSEENRSSSRSNSPYQDEIEKRLRQLGLQSSEQERKTLKQILEAMQQKGLLKPPSCSRFLDGAENQQAHSTRSPLSSKGNHSSVIPNVDKTAHIRSPDPQSLKNSMRQNSSMTCNKKQEGSASIVIMRPVGKLPSRIPAPTNGQLVESGRTMIPASTRLKKANVPRSKSGNRPETAPAKKSANASRGRPRSLSNSSSSPSSMHTPVQGCKLSLKTRQSKGNKVKGSSQTVPIEQNWKKELNLSLQQSQMETSLQDGQNKFQAIGNIGKDKCPSEDAIYRDNLRDSDKKEMEHIPTQSACLLESLSVNMSSETSFMGSRMDVTTPPRELNGDSSFGDNHNYYAKEVDQCSPVSVLDVHLSDNDVSDSQVSDEEDHRKGYKVDDHSLSCQCEEKHVAAVSTAQTMAVETLSIVDPMDKATQSNTQRLDGTENIPCPCHERLNATNFPEQGFSHDVIGSCNARDEVTTVIVDINESLSVNKESEHLNLSCSEKDDCLSSYEDTDTHTGNVCVASVDECASSITTKECYSNEEGSHQAYCLHEEIDDVCMSNVDFCYVENVLRASGIVALGTGWCIVDGWIAAGGELRHSLYEELEEHWDAIDEEMVDNEDRDMGGELYLKSQQASMRRRLIFDCVNEILEHHFSWVGIPGSSGASRMFSVATVWHDLQKLEQGFFSAEDSMYTMLEQEVLNNADYSVSGFWNRIPTELATVAVDIEQEILDSLVLEALPIPV